MMTNKGKNNVRTRIAPTDYEENFYRGNRIDYGVQILFVYSLTYPDSYKPAMPRLLKLIEDWRVLGAY